MTRAPNVVLVLGDYMGYGDIGPTGCPDIRTPNLDRLASEGVLCTDVTAAAPICSPSRAALLTGRSPARIGLEENVNFGRADIGLPAAERCIASRLRARGYRTGLFGKWHLGASEWCDPITHGFDEFLGFHDWSIDYHNHRMMNGQPGLFAQREPTTRSGYSTDVFTEESVSFIERHGSKPFFVFVSYNAALPPHQAPSKPPDLRDAATWHRGNRTDYREVVERLDTGLGEILSALNRAGVADNTIVLFTYDHGGKELARREPFFHGFASLWEGGLRVPLLVRWPGMVKAGSRFDQSASLMDLYPTLLAATGASLPAGVDLDGVNLLDAITGTGRLPERDFHWRIAFRSRRQKAIRRGPWKLLWDETAEFLFNVVDDPGERDDRFYRQPEVAATLGESLRHWEARFPEPRLGAR